MKIPLYIEISNWFWLFRLQLKDLKKIVGLKDTTNQCIQLNTAYIDSTFFSKDYQEFPTQFESIALINDLIKVWLAKGHNFKISLRTSARYGYEILFKAIFDHFHERIHVNDIEIEKYKFIPELDHCFTSNAAESRIHACYTTMKKNQLTLCCDPNGDSKYIRVIKPSAMIWRNWKKYCPSSSTDVDDASQQFIRVCYSNHSSYNEIKDLLLYLRPHRVQLNVLPEVGCTRAKMLKCVEEILNNETPDQNVEETEEKDMHIKFNKIKFCQKPKNMINLAEEDNDEELPVLVFKRRKIV